MVPFSRLCPMIICLNQVPMQLPPFNSHSSRWLSYSISSRFRFPLKKLYIIPTESFSHHYPMKKIPLTCHYVSIVSPLNHHSFPMKFQKNPQEFPLMWAKQCHLHHPPVITMFIGFPIMGGFWHCFTHIQCGAPKIAKLVYKSHN